MRAKPISFAQVLKTKGKSKDRQLNCHKKLSEMMQQFEICPDEDYTLYLSQPYHNQKNAVTSFRAISSKRSTNQQSEMFDSWIQKQSFVGNKQNIRHLIASKNMQNQSQRDLLDSKKVIVTSKGKENKEPLKTVADLVRKIDSNQSKNAPFFKANSKSGQISERARQQKALDNKDQLKTIRKRQNQQSSLRNQYEINISPPPLPEKLNAKAYIQQISVIKQQPQHPKQELKQLIAKTEFIHLDIAQLAHQYLNQAQPQLQLKEEDSLLIENSDKKNTKEPKQQIQQNNPPKLLKNQQSRWREAMSKMNIYLKKITQEEIQQPKRDETRQQINNNFSQITPKNDLNNEVGYSFAVNEPQTYKVEHDIPTLQFGGNIPKIQQIQSQRMSFQYNKQVKCFNDSPLIPQGRSIPSIQSVKLQYNPSPPQKNDHSNSPQVQFSAKRITSSLAFSDNNKDTPSPQINQQRVSNKQNENQSQQKQVTLSFTQQKPQIVINIPLNYAEEQAEQFQIQAVQIKKELIDDYQNISSLSPNKQNLFLPTRDDLYENFDEPAEELPIQQTNYNYNDFKGQANQDKYSIPLDRNPIETSQNIQIPQYQAQVQKNLKISVKEYLNSEQTFKYQEKQQQRRQYTSNSLNKQTIQKLQTMIEQNVINQHIPLILNSIPLANKTEQVQLKEQKQIISTNSLVNSITQDLTKDIQKSYKNSPKDSATKGSPSNSMFGLKKVYSSPKTNIVTLPTSSIVTSAFTDCNDIKPKPVTKVQHILEPKGYSNQLKSFQRSNKIQPVAYTYNPKKLKQSPKPIIQEESEEFQFDF